MTPILDACCGARMMWFNAKDSRCLFGDIRDESLVVTDRTHIANGSRSIHIHPDVRFDFRSLPFPDDTFYLVAFDPPHLLRAGPKSWMAAKYGKLGQDWRLDMKTGFSEMFRVLRPYGTLIFKWNETQIPLSEILACTNQRPLFGHRTGKQSRTHWVTFMKEPA